MAHVTDSHFILLPAPTAVDARPMNIVQITPGAGGMFCGGCLRDNALVAALRQAGHHALMVPLYLPLTLDEPDQSAGTPVFYSGINVFLEQKSALFRRLPAWMLKPLASRTALRWASGRAATTRAAEAGELTLSMLRGEEGLQARELDALIAWLRTQPKPDVLCLSNALLAGMARKLKTVLNAPVTCLLSGEDTFLEGLPDGLRDAAWRTLAERCRDVDLFLPPSRYFANLMQRRLALRPEQVRVVPGGIQLAGFEVRKSEPRPPTLGYFARMCREKGLDTLVEAYLLLKRRDTARELRLHVGGGCGPNDEPFVAMLKQKLAAAGVLEHTQFFPNVDRAGKLEFFKSLTVFSTPALYGEAFGLYLLEAWAAGVPVVQPRHAAFPELLDATGGGVLCEPGDPKSLADAVERLLQDPLHARHLGQHGRAVMEEQFTIERMADNLVATWKSISRDRQVAGQSHSGAG
jgi:glycosyltransferase involved in cell wall biosynthesis